MTALLAERDRLAAVEDDLAQVPGHGWYGIRAAYLWMLAGDDHHVKPGRMVIGWLSTALGRVPGVEEATPLLVQAAERLEVTPWELDHAIWTAQRQTNAARRTSRRRTGRG